MFSAVLVLVSVRSVFENWFKMRQINDLHPNTLVSKLVSKLGPKPIRPKPPVKQPTSPPILKAYRETVVNEKDCVILAFEESGGSKSVSTQLHFLPPNRVWKSARFLFIAAKTNQGTECVS